MNDFLPKLGGADWVVSSYDDWMCGPTRVPDPEGGFECPASKLASVVAALPPAKTKSGSLVSLGPPSLRAPPSSPHACRLAGETYWVEIWCRVQVCSAGRTVHMRSKTRVARVPLMVGSKIAESNDSVLDAGYFIVDGAERVFVNREVKRYDYPRFYQAPDDTFRLEINSFNCPFMIVYDAKRGTLEAHMRFDAEESFPLSVLLRALPGDESGVVEDPRVQRAMEAALGGDSTMDAEKAEQIVGKAFQKRMGGSTAKRTKLAARSVLDAPFLSFLRADEKKKFILNRVAELVEYSLGLRPTTDSYALENRHIETAGRYMASHTCSALARMWAKTRTVIESAKAASDPERHIQTSVVERAVVSAMKSGTDLDDRVTTILPRRANWWEGVAVCRRVSTKIAKGAYTLGPRMYHGSWYGFYCACETQEGEKTGLNRETALFFRCSPHTTHAEEWKKDLESATLKPGKADVLLGLSSVRKGVDRDEALAFCLKRKREAYPFASVYVEGADVHLTLTEGRAMRPVWVLPTQVDDDADFDACVAEGRVVWIDALMARTMRVATERTRVLPEHTHVELHPTSLLGPSAANIPFLDHNPGSRNLFGSHVRHQAVGDSTPFARRAHGSAHDRFDSDETNRLWYRQRALCDTQPARLMQSHRIPCGWNATVFILAKSRGQEDSMYVSRRHMDLGAVVSSTETSIEDRLGADEEFGKAADDPRLSKLDADGLPRVDALILPGDVVIAKRVKGKDASTAIWRKNFPVRVKAVVRRSDDSVSVRVGWTRWPDVGDKFASRHGQKGVMGDAIWDDDTYWTSSGVQPDFILNPHAFPSRATIGNLFEMLCGKANAVQPPPGFSGDKGCGNTITDCTPYSETYDYAAVQDLLRRNGFQPKGHETVWSAKTGLPLEAQVFVGPAFMQRLTHFSYTKCYARGRGKRNPQTGQPPKGRKQDGGLKLGEMETKAMQAYGAAHSLQTAHMECSDGIDVSFCAACDDVSSFLPDGRCVKCLKKERVVRKMPKSFMLMRDELRVARVNIGFKN